MTLFLVQGTGKNGVRIGAHKFLLATLSPVFRVGIAVN